MKPLRVGFETEIIELGQHQHTNSDRKNILEQATDAGNHRDLVLNNLRAEAETNHRNSYYV
jgi:hypothetical protein